MVAVVVVVAVGLVVVVVEFTTPTSTSVATRPGLPGTPRWVSFPCHILGFDLKFKGENLMNVLLQDVSVPASKDLE